MKVSQREVNFELKVYNKMTASDTKFYRGYLNKPVVQGNSTYHPSVDKKPVDTDYSALTEEIESIRKAPKF